MIYSLNMFGTKFFVVTVNYDVIGFQATGSQGECRSTVFKVVLSTDDFEAIKDGIYVLKRFINFLTQVSPVKASSVSSRVNS